MATGKGTPCVDHLDDSGYTAGLRGSFFTGGASLIFAAFLTATTEEAAAEAAAKAAAPTVAPGHQQQVPAKEETHETF